MDESTNHIVMKIFTYDYCRYIMVVNRNLTKDYFLDKAGIRGGYAKDMFSRIYDSIFQNQKIWWIRMKNIIAKNLIH